MKPNTYLDKTAADISKYPETITDNPGATVTLGDIHSNTMKLIWALIKEGIIEISYEDFNKLGKIYKALNYAALNKSTLLKQFASVLSNITVKPDSHLRLLGDVLGDRGTNDFLTLMLLSKLKEGDLNYEIVFSNHDDFLLDNYNKPINRWEFHNIHQQQRAMVNLHKCIKQEIITQKEVTDIIDTCVLPAMKLIAYSLSEDEKSISLFMHAPNDFDSIRKLALEFKIIDDPRYQPESAVELAKLIDKINEAFSQIKKPSQTQGRYEKAMGSSFWKPPQIDKSKITEHLKRFVWNRLKDNRPKEEYGAIDFDSYPSFVSHIAHGHTTTPKTLDPKQINLDTRLGKGLRNQQGTYLSLIQPRTITLAPGLKQPYKISDQDHIEPEQTSTYQIITAKKQIKILYKIIENTPMSANDLNKVEAVINSAEALLDGYIRKKPILEQGKLANKFEQAIDNAHILDTPKKISWDNIINVLLFIPSLTNLIKTKGKEFWLREQAINRKEFKQLLS